MSGRPPRGQRRAGRMDDKPKPHILPFADRAKRGGAETPDDDDAGELVAPGDAYATMRGVKAAASLRFLRRDGKAFAMPYAYHPIIWGESPALLLVEYPRFFTVILAGKSLGHLETQLCDRRVTWIRECDETAAAGLAVAVTRIERMNRYPSREPDGG